MNSKVNFQSKVRKIALISIVIALIVGVILPTSALLMDRRKFSEQVERMSEVEIGDTQAVVLQKMGEPEVRVQPGNWGIVGIFERETWVYGRTRELILTWEYPYIGFGLMRFGPMKGDISIEFDSDHEVMAIWFQGLVRR